MNTRLSTVFNAHADGNELRELSDMEQIQASGGRFCYKTAQGDNPTRYSSYYFRIYFQRYNSSQGRYVNVSSFDSSRLGTTGTPFSDFCRRKGYGVIID